MEYTLSEAFIRYNTLDTMIVVTMTPIEGGGIHALDVDLSVGYDFAKAGGIKHGTVALNMDYRSLIRIESLRFSTVITDSSSQEVSKRMNLGLRHTRLWNNRWFTVSGISFDRNDELGLNLRTAVGAGGGRYLTQSNTMLLFLEGGLQISRESLILEDEVTDSLEAVFSANWDWFLFKDLELDWSTKLQIFPSLTERGRARGELDTTLSWEIIGNLKWAFSLYGSWDNQPQSDLGATSDYGVNTALAYDFKWKKKGSDPINIFNNQIRPHFIRGLTVGKPRITVRPLERARRPSRKSARGERSETIHVAAFRIRKTHAGDHGSLGQMV